MQHPVIGFQITAADEAGLSDFYTKALGWTASPGPHEHVTDLATGNSSLEGSLIGRGEFIPDYVSLFVASDDIAASIAACLAHGGELIRPSFTLPNGDELGIVADPEGHVITLVRKAAG